ncbi:hypothetical protein GCM10007874_24050 [Labrys miyagiensis]|uniref:Uncharacterized protein n=1 Tax=Labrys miyagiensis TaxID=346912 RepID=A0ABQ6CI44_9HYPH|nr:hypothetical protein GCM10007874_24050 [Labrys miyagiensis]
MPVRRLDLLDGAADLPPDAAGIVDEDIDRPALSLQQGHRRRHARGIADVERDNLPLVTKQSSSFLKTFDEDIGSDDMGATGGESESDRPAEPMRRTGDEGCAA